MKRKLLVLMAMLMALANTAKADYSPNGMDRTDWDFEIYVDGKFLFFSVTDEVNLYVKMKRHPDFYYKGNINVPSKVTVSNADWIESRYINMKEKFLNKTYTVTEIDKGAFWCNLANPNYDKIETITIPSSVTKINEYAFANNNAKSITINANITEISNHAFENCPNLTSVTLPSSITSIGDNAFKECRCLSSISIPDGVTTIGNTAFSDCDLTSVKLPENLENIFVGAFYGNSSLEEIEIPAKVSHIGNIAFYYCKKLKTLKLNGVLQYFGDNVFGETALQELVYNIENAEELTVKPYDPSVMTSITIGPKTKVIAKDAFAGSQITTIEIPKNVTKICDGAFEGTAISKVEYGGTLAEWCGITFGNRTANPMCNSTSGSTTNNTCDLYIGGSKIENLVIPSGVSALKNSAFFHASFKTINLGGVTTIGQETFSGNKNLTSVNLPASVSSIGGWAFAECSNLAEVTSLNTTPPTLANNAVFKDTKSGLVAKVPLNSYLAYKNAANWNSQYSTVVPMSGTLALSDAVGYEIDKDVADCSLSYTRTVTTDNWMGVYLPFDVDVTAMDGKFATLTSIADGYLNWTTQDEGTIPACTPFIFKPASKGTIVFSAKSATLHACTEAHPVTSGGYTLNGNFTEITTMKTLGAYALSGNTFRQASKDSQTLKPFRVFIVPATPSSAPPKLMNRINGENATGIDALTIDVDLDFDFDRAYNLSGQKVGADYRGIVIENGKKVIRK